MAADGLALLGARTSAATLMMKFRSRIYTGRAIQGFIVKAKKWNKNRQSDLCSDQPTSQPLIWWGSRWYGDAMILYHNYPPGDPFINQLMKGSHGHILLILRFLCNHYGLILDVFTGYHRLSRSPDNKVHGANMGPPGADRTQVGPMLAP